MFFYGPDKTKSNCGKVKVMETDIFKEEAYDLLDDIEEALLDLGKDPTDTELLNRLFRNFHTIKGSGAMFGFSQVSDFTHSVETAIDLVRQGKVLFSEELMEIVLQSRDQILQPSLIALKRKHFSASFLLWLPVNQ
jgi:chemotaxis protein histidine kinase CheA